MCHSRRIHRELKDQAQKLSHTPCWLPGLASRPTVPRDRSFLVTVPHTKHMLRGFAFCICSPSEASSIREGGGWHPEQPSQGTNRLQWCPRQQNLLPFSLPPSLFLHPSSFLVHFFAAFSFSYDTLQLFLMFLLLILDVRHAKYFQNFKNRSNLIIILKYCLLNICMCLA